MEEAFLKLTTDRAALKIIIDHYSDYYVRTAACRSYL